MTDEISRLILAVAGLLTAVGSVFLAVRGKGKDDCPEKLLRSESKAARYKLSLDIARGRLRDHINHHPRMLP